VILAGGKSLRFGRNKALVEVGGIPLIERVVEVMGSIFQTLILITNTPEEYARLGLPMHEDLIKGIGPLGGIYTAVKRMPQEAGFFVACDMPSLNPDLIRYMVQIRNDFDVVVPRIQGKVEALHALYHKRCESAIKALIDSGNYQTFRFFNHVSVRYVEEKEIGVYDGRRTSFCNINKPGELEVFAKRREDE
jgi:molybdenum cofactor guanylyltransferase